MRPLVGGDVPAAVAAVSRPHVMSSGVLWLLCLWWCGGGCGCGGWSLPVCSQAPSFAARAGGLLRLLPPGAAVASL